VAASGKRAFVQQGPLAAAKVSTQPFQLRYSLRGLHWYDDSEKGIQAIPKALRLNWATSSR